MSLYQTLPIVLHLLLATSLPQIHTKSISSFDPAGISMQKSHSNIIIPIPIPIPVPGSTEPPREILVPVYQGRPPHNHHYHPPPPPPPLPPPRPIYRPPGSCGPRRLQFFVTEVDIPRGCHSDPLNGAIDSIQLGLEQMQWDINNFFRGDGYQEPGRPFGVRIRDFYRRMNRIFRPIRSDIRHRRKRCRDERYACQQQEENIFTMLEGFVTSLFEIPRAITCLFGECQDLSVENDEGEGEV